MNDDIDELFDQILEDLDDRVALKSNNEGKIH